MSYWFHFQFWRLDFVQPGMQLQDGREGRRGGQEARCHPWRPPFLPLVSSGCRSKSYVLFLYYK